jgi:hypothetical protein
MNILMTIFAAINNGSRFTTKNKVRNLWMIGQGFFFLQAAKGHAGELYWIEGFYEPKINLAQFSSCIPGASEMVVTYLQTHFASKTPEEMLKWVTAYFVPRKAGSLLKQPLKLNAGFGGADNGQLLQFLGGIPLGEFDDDRPRILTHDERQAALDALNSGKAFAPA